MSDKNKETTYLRALLLKIETRIHTINELIALKKAEIDEMNNHMEDYKRDMDHLEKNALRETIINFSLQGEHGLQQKKRLERLMDTAYFGRVDFLPDQGEDRRKIYVGVHNFQDDETNANLVYDWRAPISALFYDFENGPAHYVSKSGTVSGTLTRKRQFRIRKGKMEYMLDTNVTIHDDVLLKELNQTSSTKMKNIVATIQKEQNQIIRNESDRHVIIQGVAGSGKTSIALHRIAFLLYRYDGTITSDDILIISPNKVFASYISNVLPELGEETVEETNMENIANDILEYQIKFQSFSEQVEELLTKNDNKLIERIRFKSGKSFLRTMDEYLKYLENEGFKPVDIFIRKKPVPAWFIGQSFQRFSRLPMLKRFNEVVREIVENVYKHYKIEIQYKDRSDLHKMVRAMFPSYNIRILYKGFYAWLGRPDLFKARAGSKLEWSDVYALIYLKMKLEGIKAKTATKHLVVDEMQDYSAVQYRVLASLFPCKKTILGDINQSVNPFSSSNIETIGQIFPDSSIMIMQKSYRSTFEITNFTARIAQNLKVEALERHGEEPEVTNFADPEKLIRGLKERIESFRRSGRNSLGLIFKTFQEAENFYMEVKDAPDVQLLNSLSSGLNSGVIVSSAHLSKGLEFDEVVVSDCNKKNYHTEADRQMLYVACTRAMHRLSLFYVSELTSILSPGLLNDMNKSTP